MIRRIALSLLMVAAIPPQSFAQVGLPSAPGIAYVTAVRPWPGVTAPIIDPAFVIGTTGLSLGAVAAGAGGSTYTLPSATQTVKGGVTISTGLSVIGSALSVSYGTTSGTAAQGNDNRITGAAQISNNLSDLLNANAARSNLGLGTMAVQNTNNVAITGGTISGVTIAGNGAVTSISAGTGLAGGTITTSGSLSVLYGAVSGTAAQGNDSRIVGAVQNTSIGVVGGIIAQIEPDVATGSGTIAANITLELGDCVSACTLTLPSSAAGGWPLAVMRWGAGIVSVTGSINGSATTIDLNNPTVKEAVGFVWSTAKTSWIRIN